jgi:hypothetical protein
VYVGLDIVEFLKTDPWAGYDTILEEERFTIRDKKTEMPMFQPSVNSIYF